MAVGIAGCGGGGDGEDTPTETAEPPETPTPTNSSGPQTHTVDMTDNLKFDPDSLTISKGDTVKWKNVGSIGHTVTAYEDEIPDNATYFASGGFDSESKARNNTSKGLVKGGETYTHTFNTKGTYKYFCIPHESVGMKGSITVE